MKAPASTIAPVPSWCAPRLRIVTPDGPVARAWCIDLPTEEAQITMGRDAAATIRLPDPWVSRRHALLSIRQGRLVIHDLGSRWGTRLNAGTLAGPRPLADGDTLVIGATSIVVEHPWKASPVEGRRDLPAQEGSGDGIGIFDSTSRIVPAQPAKRTQPAAPAWERPLARAAAVLLAASAVLLAWRLLTAL